MLRRGDRLLVRVPDWLGDLVMAEPALRALHERVRELDGALTLAGSPRLFEVFDGRLDGVRRVDADDANAWRGHDVALLLTGSFRSAWSAARALIPRRVGQARDGRTWLLTQSVVPARELGATPLTLGIHGPFPRYLPRPFGATCVELAHSLGATVRDTRPRLEPSNAGLGALAKRLKSFGLRSDESFVLANVGARSGSAKGWPAESWASALSGFELPIVLVGGPTEEPVLERVRALTRDARVFACLEPLAGLGELVALCAAARLVLTADAGPRHVANAVGAPLVVVCGPSDPRHTADHNSRTLVLRAPVDCGPCHRERCPLSGEGELRCMRDVEPQRVANAARERLASMVKA